MASEAGYDAAELEAVLNVEAKQGPLGLRRRGQPPFPRPGLAGAA